MGRIDRKAFIFKWEKTNQDPLLSYLVVIRRNFVMKDRNYADVAN